MKSHVTRITLGVDDLEKSLAFSWDGLGLKSDGIVGGQFDQGAVVFVDLQPGLRWALLLRGILAWDTGLPRLVPVRTSFPWGIMWATSRIRTNLFGKWLGTRSGRLTRAESGKTC